MSFLISFDYSSKIAQTIPIKSHLTSARLRYFPFWSIWLRSACVTHSPRDFDLIEVQQKCILLLSTCMSRNWTSWQRWRSSLHFTAAATNSGPREKPQPLGRESEGKGGDGKDRKRGRGGESEKCNSPNCCLLLCLHLRYFSSFAFLVSFKWNLNAFTATGFSVVLLSGSLLSLPPLSLSP